ncbi:MAG: response regulator [Kofleriaceae bacterium]|nr:response regulator [Myxococcales bacterium]MCB9560204.1 response regulator [Kofleriaceae bacterium]MCB9571233.1 response regulator [Kofleriaceae bacterium]
MSTRRHILLVEDNPDDAELTRIALEEGGLVNQLIWLKDGAEALAHLLDDPARELPELVLLDLKMPRVGGLEVLRRIRGDARTRRLPVVILTTSSEDVDLIDSYDLGANSYVRKPVDFDQFTRAVQQLKLYWLVLNEAPPLPRSSPS